MTALTASKKSAVFFPTSLPSTFPFWSASFRPPPWPQISIGSIVVFAAGRLQGAAFAEGRFIARWFVSEFGFSLFDVDEVVIPVPYIVCGFRWF